MALPAAPSLVVLTALLAGCAVGGGTPEDRSPAEGAAPALATAVGAAATPGDVEPGAGAGAGAARDAGTAPGGPDAGTGDDSGEATADGAPASASGGLAGDDPASPAPTPGATGSDDGPAASGEPSEAAVDPGPFIVAADGSERFETIAEALIAAPFGAEIAVQPGLYEETVVLDKGHQLVHGDRPGQVVLDGGPRPAVRLSRQVQARVQGLLLKGGESSGAVVLIERGQLVLEECRLDVPLRGVGIRSHSQLVARDVVVHAGAGSALGLGQDTGTALHGFRVSWDAGNFQPVLAPGPRPPVTLRGGQLGRLVLQRPVLLDDELLSDLPDDGRLPVRVAPEPDSWPPWALEDQTHFRTIQRALDGAPPRAVIQVAPGVYRERVGLLRSVELMADGEPGSVKLVWEGEGRAALWMNGQPDTVVAVTGFLIRSDASDGKASVQVNGGKLSLRDCEVRNAHGSALVVTDHHAPSHVTLAGSTLDCKGPAALVTGGGADLLTSAATLASGTAAVILMDGSRAQLKGSTLRGRKSAVEVWGLQSRANLVGCRIEGSNHPLVFDQGAMRSQITTRDVTVD